MLEILKVKEEEYRNIYIMSDIHGNNKLLKKMLATLEYGKEDLFIFLGDSWDRGSEVREVFETFTELKKDSNLLHILGNHEKMMYEYFCYGKEMPYLLQSNGAKSTIEILDSDEELLNDILDFIEQMPNIIETNTAIFVHAGIDLTKSLDKQDEEFTLWTKSKFWQRNRKENKQIFYGHVIQPYGKITVESFFNSVAMDCGTYKYKRLGCYELKSKEIKYVSEE